MKVRELLESLEGQDPEAEVLIVTQPRWPFEYDILHVKTREDVGGPKYSSEYSNGSDVLLVSGEQLRYGMKGCWDE